MSNFVLDLLINIVLVFGVVTTVVGIENLGLRGSVLCRLGGARSESADTRTKMPSPAETR